MFSNSEIKALLQSDENQRQEIISKAEQLRISQGGKVYLRGLIELGSFCRRSCLYCGLRSENHNAKRYRLELEDIITAAKRVKACQIETVVLQSGEDTQLSTSFMEEVLGNLTDLGLVVTLSLGERQPEELACWKRAGASRYLLRFETSNESLFKKLHPSIPGQNLSRIELLGCLKDLGYEVGSGFMVGLPGQTYDDLVQDILLCQKLDLDMIGIGPFVAHPETPLFSQNVTGNEQVPASAELTRLVLAILANMMPTINLPSTTALATVGGGGAKAYLAGLQAGANVIMPDFTPDKFRHFYDIYPGKAAFISAEDLVKDLNTTLTAAGRPIALGAAGCSHHYLARIANPQ